MFFQFNIFGTILVVASILALFVAYYSFKRKDNRIYFYLALFSLVFFLDSFFQGLDCLITPFFVKAFLGQLSAFGYLFIAPVWLLLVYCLTHNQKDLPVKYAVPMLTVSGIFLILTLTNPWTHFMFSNISLPTNVAYKLQLYYTGTWVYTFVWLYGFFLSFIALLMLCKALIFGSKIYRNSYFIALISLIFADVVSLLSLTTIYTGFSYTVTSYLIIFIFLTIATYVYDAFDIINLVNESVLHEVDIGILYFNNMNILSNINPASNLIGISDDNLKSEVNTIFKDNPDLLNFYFDDNLKIYNYKYEDSWFEIKKTLFNKDDVYLGKIFTINDITSQVNELNQKDMLVREVNHRVKNNLQIILSLLNLDLRFNPNDPMSVVNDTRSRLNYMSTLHDKLYTSGDSTEVNVQDYLPSIAEGLLNMYNSNIKLKSNINDVMIDLDLAIPLGLILTEVMNNTIKYAYPKGEEGNFYIDFNKIENNGILDLYDEGVGLSECFNFQSSSGLGMTVIKSLTQQIGGESCIIQDKGAHFRFKFPLN